ncbi:g_PROTEIN_RECEP_F2_3 domain-containing protein [Caerostris darwini]|uniref:G_PROTEIN_RECEP_F2_3 domain-containing protein n=1 Tax=Caerostris darwini TaxID=1538125 RepID=A0AAV4PMJ4_9ARAC|nr:g_PROTEIN_RECEP_F2_3 domain-containing protein [Caerostris darwini]
MSEINDEFTTIYPTSDELSFDEFYCNLSYLNQANVSNESFCNATWDGLSCWPATLAGSTATISCFPEFNGVKYDVSGKSNSKHFTIIYAPSLFI